MVISPLPPSFVNFQGALSFRRTRSHRQKKNNFPFCAWPNSNRFRGLGTTGISTNFVPITSLNTEFTENPTKLKAYGGLAITRRCVKPVADSMLAVWKSTISSTVLRTIQIRGLQTISFEGHTEYLGGPKP